MDLLLGREVSVCYRTWNFFLNIFQNITIWIFQNFTKNILKCLRSCFSFCSVFCCVIYYFFFGDYELHVAVCPPGRQLINIVTIDYWFASPSFKCRLTIFIKKLYLSSVAIFLENQSDISCYFCHLSVFWDSRFPNILCVFAPVE